jgi:hypothetical protein
MWARRFCGSHKTASKTSPVLVLHCFSLPVTVWRMGFLPHAVHGSMLNQPRCECESMHRLNFQPHQNGSTYFLKIEDNGTAALTHHLPVDFKKSCFFASATARDCGLLEGLSTSNAREGVLLLSANSSKKRLSGGEAFICNNFITCNLLLKCRRKTWLRS